MRPYDTSPKAHKIDALDWFESNRAYQYSRVCGNAGINLDLLRIYFMKIVDSKLWMEAQYGFHFCFFPSAIRGINPL
ncbi:hypothetical protein SAMN04515620_14733 [Collimonas sp. OK607]|nr:hypothetical protein SAMN04515620_14733 [Collimonas sp. OK607]